MKPNDICWLFPMWTLTTNIWKCKRNTFELTLCRLRILYRMLFGFRFTAKASWNWIGGWGEWGDAKGTGKASWVFGCIPTSRTHERNETIYWLISLPPTSDYNRPNMLLENPSHILNRHPTNHCKIQQNMNQTREPHRISDSYFADFCNDASVAHLIFDVY